MNYERFEYVALFGGKSSGGRWILITKDQLYGKCVYVMASSCLDAGKKCSPRIDDYLGHKWAIKIQRRDLLQN